MKTAHANRRKVQQPRHGKGWCSGCDAYYGKDTEKCSVCGYKEGPKRAKKPAPTLEEFD